MPNEKFQEFLEEKNIFWMDDFPLVNTMILKFIKNCKVKSFDKNFCFKLYSNSSDKKYSNDLANLSLRNFKKNNELINKYVSNWDVDRIAKIDLVILNLAITEIIDFKLIPVKVSLNEFIEISKDYSTEKSSFFINGILDKLVKDLLEKKSLIKEGRGLRE
jgi:N utilization substance protein B